MLSPAFRKLLTDLATRGIEIAQGEEKNIIILKINIRDKIEDMFRTLVPEITRIRIESADRPDTLRIVMDIDMSKVMRNICQGLEKHGLKIADSYIKDGVINIKVRASGQ